MKKTNENNFSGNSILLHVCCAPCAAGCIERLLGAYKKVGLYFSNSNIATLSEYNLRKHSVEQLSEIYDLPLFCDEYNHSGYLSKVLHLSNEPEGGRRCMDCFKWSLARSENFRSHSGYEFFATSLTVSPRKSSAVIFEAASIYPAFHPWNFKLSSGYLTGVELSKKHGFYRQNFCGCEFSLR